MGRFIGRIHKVGNTSLFTHRQTVDCATTLYFAKDILDTTGLIPDSLRTAFWAIFNPVVKETEARFNAVSTSQCRLHGDCHPGNILWRDGPTFVDLDDAKNGPAIQDIWMMLSGDRPQRMLQLDTLLEAYSEFNDLSKKEFALIELCAWCITWAG
jgi:Ser/Thr protein kinase RdoA (MazF antagonist)